MIGKVTLAITLTASAVLPFDLLTGGVLMGLGAVWELIRPKRRKR